MRLPINYDFPLLEREILSGDPQKLLNYLEELVLRLRFSFNDVSESANGYSSTFTPVVVGSTSAGSGTYDTQVGLYHVIGELCWFTIQLEWDDANHTGTGNVTITGLPRTSSLETSGNLVFTAYDAEAGSVFTGVATMEPNTTVISSVMDSAGTVAQMNADHTLTITGIYRVQ